MSPSNSRFKRDTSSTTLPVRIVELFHVGCSRVDETTYLGEAIQPVRQFATPGWPSRGEPFVRPPAHQHCVAAEGLIEREPGKFGAVLDQPNPSAATEALVARRVFDDPVERQVVAHDDRSRSVVSHCFVS